jgi:hypothetical protein
MSVTNFIVDPRFQISSKYVDCAYVRVDIISVVWKGYKQKE